MTAQVFSISVLRYRRSPLRTPRWDAVVGQGDDFKLALTVYNTDSDTAPQDVSAALCQLSIWPLMRDWRLPWYDYGAISMQPFICQAPYLSASGFVWDGPNGRLNIQLTAAQTAQIWGRFGMAIQIDFGDGLQTVLTGVFGIERSSKLAASGRTWFTLDVSSLDGPDLLAPGVFSTNVPVDDFGFPIGAAATT